MRFEVCIKSPIELEILTTLSIKLINKAIGFKRQTSAESKNMLTLVPTDKIRRLKMFIIGNRISLTLPFGMIGNSVSKLHLTTTHHTRLNRVQGGH